MNEPVDPQIIEALRRDRGAPAPDDAQARIASRLGVSGPVSGGRLREGSTAAAPPGAAHTAAMLALTFLGGAVTGALLHASFTSGSAARAVHVDAPPSPAPSAPSPPSVAAPQASGSARSSAVGSGSPSGERSTAEAPPRAAPVAASLAASVVASSPSPHLAQLDAERALLDAARVALVAGESDVALHALDQHAKAYARPLLGEEHDALLVQALVRAGRYAEARSRADAFRRKAPRSLFLPAVDAAIASIP